MDTTTVKCRYLQAYTPHVATYRTGRYFKTNNKFRFYYVSEGQHQYYPKLSSEVVVLPRPSMLSQFLRTNNKSRKIVKISAGKQLVKNDQKISFLGAFYFYFLNTSLRG
jgi:hypothetical protein